MAAKQKRARQSGLFALELFDGNSADDVEYTCLTAECGKTFVKATDYRQGYGSLRKHLKQQHPAQWKRLLQYDSEGPAPKKNAGARPIDGFFQPSSSVDAETAVRNAQAEIFILHSIPFRIVRDPGWECYVKAQRSFARTLSEFQLRESASALAASYRRESLAKVKSSKTPISVCIDGWTNINRAKITNVLLVWREHALYWTSIVNADDANSAEWLWGKLKPVMESLMQENVKIVALALDNENWSKAVVNLAIRDYPWLVHVPCTAHILNLVVGDVIKIAGIQAVVDNALDIIRQFDTSKSLRNRLKASQAALGQKPKVLVKPCETRWNSQLKAMSRLYEERSAVDVLVPQNVDFWMQLKDVCSLLLPFEEAINKVQSDSATQATVYKAVQVLYSKVKHLNNTGEWMRPHIAEAAESISTRWLRMANTKVAAACTQFSFEEIELSELAKEPVKNTVVEFGTSYLPKFRLTNKEGDTLASTIRHQYGFFESRTGFFASVDEEIDVMKRDALNLGTDFKPAHYWLQVHVLHAVPELAHIALGLLACTASEASVERSFSAQKFVHSRDRPRISDVSVEDEMMIRFNAKCIKSLRPDDPNAVEPLEFPKPEERPRVLDMDVDMASQDDDSEDSDYIDDENDN